MNGRLLKTPAAHPGVAAALAGHPRAGAGTTPSASAREVRAPQDAPTSDDVRAQQQRSAEELEALRRAAHEEGLRQGRQDALRQAELAAARQDAALHAMVKTVEAAVCERLDKLEALALTIAYEACATVLSESALAGSAVTDTVRRLLQPLRQTAGVRVQLHPDDLARVSQALRDDPRHASQALRYEGDPTLAAGDCRVVTPHGQLESGLAIQLTTIRDCLLATHGERQAQQR